MGVPKRLTEMQQKFANLLVSNEGRKTAYECAIEAGYEKDRARITASELQNPKKYPLVVKHIGEIREEYQKKYEVSKEEMEKELKSILDEYSPLLQDVTTDDVKQKVKEKRLPRLKKVSSPSSPKE